LYENRSLRKKLYLGERERLEGGWRKLKMRSFVICARWLRHVTRMRERKCTYYFRKKT
jgi:hypothetical protein